ncbi:MAG TPA: alpha/beta fold hydrolase [Candidatus Udaeobacter sp.]|nr:alpha/beta fold hydrolase [Candidatus Udaeobacter sp.]
MNQNPKMPAQHKTSDRVRSIAVVACLAFFAGCATTPQTAGRLQYAPAASIMREARSSQVPVEKRAADYLQVAAMTATLLGTGAQETPARDTYNAACGELTVLLRSSEGGRLWNHPLTLTGNNNTYHLRLEPAASAVWAPNYFTTFELEGQVKEKLIRKENIQQGVGGALVGVRRLVPSEKFAPPRGISAAVTATLDFHAKDVTLALRRPAKNPTASVEGKVRPLAANFSAPISYYKPPSNLALVGLVGGFEARHYPAQIGLYFLQPYDPDRIPLVFVHGLFSTPFTWVETINGLQADPEIRKHYQFWVFAYPTGYPILYSALRLRQELARVDQAYPNHKPYVVVGHSMGGMLTHDQVITVTQAMWEKALGQTARNIFRQNSSDSLVVRATTFRANPRIKRVVFICTPHRGSDMASGGLGRFAISLITLPGQLATVMKDALSTGDLVKLTGSAKRLPNSVWGLKPSNPALPVINEAPISVPYHSIIGDRGKGNSPNSSDGVVAYWSSHLDGAKSELIVPGPHGSCELPQTIAELDRILRLNLGMSSTSQATLAKAVP